VTEQLLLQQLESPSGTGRVEPRSDHQPDRSVTIQQRDPNRQVPFSLAVLGGHVEWSEHQDVDVALNAGCMRQSGVG